MPKTTEKGELIFSEKDLVKAFSVLGISQERFDFVIKQYNLSPSYYFLPWAKKVDEDTIRISKIHGIFYYDFKQSLCICLLHFLDKFGIKYYRLEKIIQKLEKYDPDYFEPFKRIKREYDDLFVFFTPFDEYILNTFEIVNMQDLFNTFDSPVVYLCDMGFLKNLVIDTLDEILHTDWEIISNKVKE